MLYDTSILLLESCCLSEVLGPESLTSPDLSKMQNLGLILPQIY